MSKRVLLLLLGLCTLLLVGWVSPLGSGVRCGATLREGLVFEVPEVDVTVRHYQEEIDKLTNGCGVVASRSGPINPDDIVVCCSGGREAITSANRLVYVTTEPGETTIDGQVENSVGGSANTQT